MESEMQRVPLNEGAINQTLNLSYWRVSVFQSLSSTQSELALKKNLKHGDVYLSEFQSDGKGRLDRSFEAAASSALLLSIYLKPKRSKSEWSLIPLIVGLSLLQALKNLDNNFQCTLKWPNDLLVGSKKVAGILVEATADGVIIGIGLNVGMAKEQLPVPTATSLFLENFNELDRNIILPEVLTSLADSLSLWESSTESLLAQYCAESSTLGREVEVLLPDGRILKSIAIGITNSGELKLASGEQVSVGDVIHLR
jgi:BirA family biotin operon repressor/biotin-[acetyl-CoA-carboxylase] ligase